MIKARLQTEQGPVYFLGIDAENVKRLQAGKPIQVDLTSMGGTGRVVIVYGHTMADIQQELEGAFGPMPIAQPTGAGHA